MRPQRLHGEDLTGRKFGSLTVLYRADKNRHGQYRWLCACDCGVQKQILVGQLKHTATPSCGCKKGESISRAKTLHGHSRVGGKTPTYNSWRAMIGRCQDPKNKAWGWYGGRGIKVCERWQEFENFLSDMGERPTGLTLDRINNNGDYEPANCRWASIRVQRNNKSDNRPILAFGRVQSIAEWAREVGLKYRTLMHRLNLGWEPEQALSVPIGVSRTKGQS